MKTQKITLNLLIFFVLFSVKAFAQQTNIQFVKNKYVNFDRNVGGDVRCVAYSPDGYILASGDTDDNIHLWDPFVFSKESPVFLKHSASVNCIAFSPDGEWLAAGSDDGVLRLWKLGPTKERWDWVKEQAINITEHWLWIIPKFHRNDIRSVAFNHHEGRDLLACGTSGGKVYVWEYKGKKWSNKQTGEGHKSDVNSIAFSPRDSGSLASGSTDGKVLLWKINSNGNFTSTGRILSEETGVNSIAFSPDGAFLASGTDATATDDGKVTVWKMDGSDTSFLSLSGLHTNSVRSVAFSPDGTVLASADAYGDICVWDAPQETQNAPLQGYALRKGQNTHGINSIAFVRHEGETDEEYSMALASGSDDHHLRQWVFEKLQLAPDNIELKQPKLLFSDVAFSPGGDAIYFILNVRFLPLGGAGDVIHNNVIYDKGSITLDIAWVPSDSLAANDPRLDTPGYFLYPLKTPAERLTELNARGFFSTYVSSRDLAYAVAGETAGLAIDKTVEKAVKKAVEKGLERTFTYGTTAVGTTIGTMLFPGVGTAVGAAVGFAAGLAFDMLVSKVQYEMEQHEARLEILAASADPTIVFSNPFGEEVGLRPHKDEYLCLLRKPEWWNGNDMKDLTVIMQQKHRLTTHSDTVAPTFVVLLEYAPNLTQGIQGAPSSVQSMSLSNYPPFQKLPLEVQEYLLRQFGEFMPPREATDWQIPEMTSLLPNYPNPFNPETWLPYQLSKPADVTLTIYDIQGRVVRDLGLGHQPAGMYHSRSRAAHWDGRNAQGESVASGLYFYTLKAGDFTATRKMLIRK